MLRAAKNKVNGYTPAQVLVRECTRNNETQDVPIMQLRELVEYSYSPTEIVPMFDMLDKRLNDKGKYWKHILKALIVLEYLVINGSQMCVTWCQENIYLIKTLREFMWRHPVTDVDYGDKIRLKAKELTSLLLDEARLRREREMAEGNRKRNNNSSRRPPNNFDNDLQKAMDESMRTAREEEEKRRNMQQDSEDMKIALELSKEEEEIRRLKELQRLQQLQLQQQQQMQMQQQNMMYDINGNPISPEEYQQFLQQQQQLQYQQYLEQLQQQQQMLLQQQQYEMQQQQYEMQQQQMRAQEEANKQNILQQYSTGNPFKQEPQQPKQEYVPEPEPIPEPQQPMKRTRTGDAAISAKYSELNSMLMNGTGIDTFGNTGASRIPAHHTKTGTFINSQGTGYYQQSAPDNKPVGSNPTGNPFLKDQYTGFYGSVKEQKTGFGFGNAPSMNTSQGRNEHSLIDL